MAGSLTNQIRGRGGGMPTSQVLAAKIVERLVQERLLRPEDAEKMKTDLASGRIRQEDWRLSIELAGESASKP